MEPCLYSIHHSSSFSAPSHTNSTLDVSFICSDTLVRRDQCNSLPTLALQSAIFDFPSLLTVLLLFICSCTYVGAPYLCFLGMCVILRPFSTRLTLSLPSTPSPTVSVAATYARSDQRYMMIPRIRVVEKVFCHFAGKLRASASASALGLEQHVL